MGVKLELTTHHPAADDWESNVRGGVTPQTKRVRNRAANLLSLRDISPIG